MMPKIGLLVCGSNASNTGAITAMVAMEIIEEHKIRWYINFDNNLGIKNFCGDNKYSKEGKVSLILTGSHGESMERNVYGKRQKML